MEESCYISGTDPSVTNLHCVKTMKFIFGDIIWKTEWESSTAHWICVNYNKLFKEKRTKFEKNQFILNLCDTLLTTSHMISVYDKIADENIKDYRKCNGSERKCILYIVKSILTEIYELLDN